MKIVGRLLIAIMLMISSLTFFACEMPSQPELSCSGVVTFNNQGLNDVTIKSSIKDYTTTDANGNYTFLTKAKSIIIYPEKDYVNEGVGVFMQGFEHIGKYHYSKTGKKISFYPMFVSQKNKEMYIGTPIIYNPEEKHNIEKERIVTYLRNEMVAQYEKFEVNKPSKKKRNNKKNKDNNSYDNVQK